MTGNFFTAFFIVTYNVIQDAWVRDWNVGKSVDYIFSYYFIEYLSSNIFTDYFTLTGQATDIHERKNSHSRWHSQAINVNRKSTASALGASSIFERLWNPTVILFNALRLTTKTLSCSLTICLKVRGVRCFEHAAQEHNFAWSRCCVLSVNNCCHSVRHIKTQIDILQP